MAHGRIRFGQSDVVQLADTIAENPGLERHYRVLRERVYEAERAMGEFFADFLEYTPRDTEDIDFLIQGVDSALEEREEARTVAHPTVRTPPLFPNRRHRQRHRWR